jgi:hypothetical protein
MKSEIEINNEMSNIINIGRRIIHAVNNNEEHNLDDFVNFWNKYIENGGKVKESLIEIFNSIFGLTMNRLVRVRKIRENPEWKLLDLGNLPNTIRLQLSKKKSVYKYHKWWVMAKTHHKDAPFYFIHRGRKTFILIHDQRSFSFQRGIHQTHLKRYREFLNLIGEEVISGHTRMSIGRKFNLTFSDSLGRVNTGKKAKSLYLMKWEFAILDDFFAYYYYNDLKRTPTNKTIHSQYYGDRHIPNHIFTYELHNSVFCGVNFKYFLSIVNENAALKDLIHYLFYNKDFLLWVKALISQNPDLTEDNLTYQYLKMKFGSSSLKIARLWNKFRFKNCKLITINLNNRMTSIYSIDNVKTRLKPISDEEDVFLNEDRLGSFTQYVEALMEEKSFRISLNSNIDRLNLSEDVYTEHIGKHNSKSHDNIATLPDVAIYSICDTNVEFVLAKRYRGLIGIDPKGNFAEDFLLDMGKSFQDPAYNTRHFNCGIFAYKDIINESGVAESLPLELIREVQNRRAGICLIGIWTTGPEWMTRFGELLSAVRIESFVSNSRNKPLELIFDLEKIFERFSRGKKILKGVRRKQISNKLMRYLLNILEISDEDGYTVHYWITDVIFRFIGEYAKFLNLKLNPIKFNN